MTEHALEVDQTGRYSNLPFGRFDLLMTLSEPRLGQAVRSLSVLIKRKRIRG